MKRDLDGLGHGTFDLLVVGGGIYGAWTAYDAALRGLRVALVERTDWGAGTSSRSSKLIHGGLRYLEHGHIGVVRKSLHERALLQRLAPHRARDLRFALPVLGGGPLRRWRLQTGLFIYDLLAGGGQPGGRFERLSADAMSGRYPFIRRRGLSGGFTFGDAVTDDARLVLEIVDAALAAGAVAVNHAEVIALADDRERITGAEIRDGDSGEIVQVRAAVVANCAGAWSPGVAGGDQASRPRLRLTRGVHLVLPALPTTDAFLLPDSSRRRVVFLIPWYGRTLLGTTDTDFSGSADSVGVERADVDYLLDMAAGSLEQPWRESDIIAAFAGLRVLPRSGGAPSAVSREFSIHESAGGLLTPVGGKISSARVDAAGLVDRVMARLGRRGECSTGERPLPWAPTASEDGHPLELAGLDAETAAACRERYGRHAPRIAALAAALPGGGERIMPGAPFCRAELIHAVRHEMATGLEDVLRRRLPLLLIDPPDAPCLWEAARIVAHELGWDDSRVRLEVESLLSGAADRLITAP